MRTSHLRLKFYSLKHARRVKQAAMDSCKREWFALLRSFLLSKTPLDRVLVAEPRCLSSALSRSSTWPLKCWCCSVANSTLSAAYILAKHLTRSVPTFTALISYINCRILATKGTRFDYFRDKRPMMLSTSVVLLSGG